MLSKTKPKRKQKQSDALSIDEQVRLDLHSDPNYDPAEYAERFLPEMQRERNRQNAALAAKGFSRW